MTGWSGSKTPVRRSLLTVEFTPGDTGAEAHLTANNPVLITITDVSHREYDAVVLTTALGGAAYAQLPPGYYHVSAVVIDEYDDVLQGYGAQHNLHVDKGDDLIVSLQIRTAGVAEIASALEAGPQPVLVGSGRGRRTAPGPGADRAGAGLRSDPGPSGGEPAPRGAAPDRRGHLRGARSRLDQRDPGERRTGRAQPWSATATRSASGASRCASTSRERTGSSPWVHTWDNGAVNPRTVVILGSTGSVGTQALELIGA